MAKDKNVSERSHEQWRVVGKVLFRLHIVAFTVELMRLFRIPKKQRDDAKAAHITNLLIKLFVRIVFSRLCPSNVGKIRLSINKSETITKAIR